MVNYNFLCSSLLQWVERFFVQYSSLLYVLHYELGICIFSVGSWFGICTVGFQVL